MPLEIFQVEITSRCNLRCNFCPHSELKRPKGDMRVEDFKRVAANFRRGQRVGLYMLGEPLLHPAFFELVKITTDFGCVPEIASNSFLLTSEEYIDQVLLSGIDFLILDITRHKEDKKVVDRCRINALNTVRRACRLFDKGEVVPNIFVQIVASKKHPEVFPSNMIDFSMRYPNLIQLSRKFLDTWAGAKRELYDESEIEPPAFRLPCVEPWERCAVLQNGDVVPCCRDAHGEYPYGNLFYGTLDEIDRTSLKLKTLRMLHTSRDWSALPPPCKHCREWHIPMDRHLGEVP